MRGRLDLTVRFPVMRVLVDFNNLGFSQIDEWEDITDYVTDISGSKEKEGELLGGASSDLITITLDNSEKMFSKDNSNSPYYQKVKSNIKFVLRTGFKEEELTDYAVGYVESFKPRWKGKDYLMTTTCPMKKLKKTPVPTSSYQDVTWDEAVGILLDEAGLDSYFVRNIPKTEFYFKYLKFEEPTCFDALKKLLEMAVGQAFFEGNEFKVTTKLALDYVLDTMEKHDVIVDDLYELDENVDTTDIINKVSLTSDYKEIGPLQVVWQTPENFTKVSNEQVVYDGDDYVYINPENLPLYWSESEDITIKNLTTGVDIEWDVYNAELGRVHLTSTGKANCSTGDLLSLSYTYQLLVIMPSETRTFTANLSSEVANIMEPDVVAWNSDVTVQVPYSQTPDAAGTVSKQALSIQENGTIVKLTLKNNTSDKVSISTLQFRGYPVQSLNPIEVYNKDLPSINEFETQEVTIQNNYLNNVKLAEKISQYLIDNNGQPRKKITIQINGYPELLLNDIMKVVEADSGTNHKFTIERLDYQFSQSNGWTVNLDLKEIDTVQWTYESFAGQSYGKSNTGNPTADFIKEINANLMSNGGAELYSGADDVNDIGAISQVHNIPDYWSFTRSTGNATARVRDGGGLVLHGGKSFEITTTNGGAGYFSQIINGIKPSQPYTLSLIAKADSCSGKAIIEQYDGANSLLHSDEVTVTTYTDYELTIVSHASTEAIVVKLQKESGGGTTENVWFDKVKLENDNNPSTYIETEETSAVQINKQYANSLTIGNQYGIEVYDDQNNPRVRMGQYEAGKYGLQIYGGGIEIINGLPKDQIDPETTNEWDNKDVVAKDDSMQESGVHFDAGAPVFTRPTTRDYKGHTYAIDEPIYDMGGIMVDPAISESLTIPTANVLDPLEGTIEAVIIPLVLNDYNNYFRMDYNASSRFLLFTSASGKVYFSINDWGGPSISTGDGVAVVGERLKIALRWSTLSKTMSLFVNGVKVGTDVYQYSTYGDFPATMSLIYNYSSVLCDLRISKVARTDNEILQGGI
ncbi:LamG domain-containing protein [Priestia megaterium]|uniref:LamG domain-containing protein n=1 Tax=Priestia megaterium TaxID=1404 RepID=UPI00211CBF81|nr:LamG domain-containing protein [Priestia megaterium]